MLKRLHRITKRADFDRIFRERDSYNHSLFYAKNIRNGFNYSRFGFVVGVKLFKKANKRNKAKRLMREAVRLNLGKIKSGFDIIIGVKSGEIQQMNCGQVEYLLMDYFDKRGLLK